jgi:hypothetical protein
VAPLQQQPFFRRTMEDGVDVVGQAFGAHKDSVQDFAESGKGVPLPPPRVPGTVPAVPYFS